MKKNLILIVVAILVSFTSFSQNVSGVYNTDYKQMTLTQIGNKVTGTYEGANGKIQAILNGNRLVGTWKNSASNKTGNFEFIFNSSFSSFTGKYGYNNNGPTKKWNGKKVNSTASTNTIKTSPVKIINIAGEYATDYGKMTLNQNGNLVTGNYEGGNGTLKGNIEGNRFFGTWKNSSNSRTGNFEFIFNSDLSAFTGKYGYNTATPTKKWNGKKVNSTASTNTIKTSPVKIINIAGEYATDYGKMILNQNGNLVSGNYEGGNGTIKGNIEGNRFFGTWKNSSNSRTGSFEFIFNSDLSAFTGKYGYNTATPTKKWNGKKVKSTASTNTIKTSPVKIINISGEYATDYGKMTLNQNGNLVSGNYEGGNGTIKGNIEGNRFFGTWKNSSNSRTGSFEFIFNSDLSAFTGKYGYNTATPTKKWNGKKVKSFGNTITTNPIQIDLPINIIGSWSSNGNRNHRGRANIWQEGNKFTVIVSWIDEERNLWKSYKGEGKFEGREMNFKVYPAVTKGLTVDQGYVYHWKISSDNNQITCYYTRYGKRTTNTNVYYKRVD
ncbi:hypothetical protein [uncultured Lutibacter sp.]|uniref:hypothetical protein n=1 Tax=uncultured Lutibacter sp. TaxID=437739 RepID=UPI0026344671|nr:hypothetical protein [uncultured Lutibacter sp.]